MDIDNTLLNFDNADIFTPDNISKIPYIYRKRFNDGNLHLAGMVRVAEMLDKKTKTVVVV